MGKSSRTFHSNNNSDYGDSTTILPFGSIPGAKLLEHDVLHLHSIPFWSAMSSTSFAKGWIKIYFDNVFACLSM